MKRALAIGGVIAGVLLVLWALFGGATDEEKIRARLERLEEAVGFTGDGQNPVFRVAHLNEEFNALFTEHVSVSIPELNGARGGRRALAGLASRATAHLHALDVEFSDVAVAIDRTGSAEVTARAQLDAVRIDGENQRDEREVTFRFVETNGDWLIDAVRATPAHNDDNE